MNDIEVDKIIAEYMGWEEYPPYNETIGYSAKVEDGGYVVELPTKSLDSLVPVWERLVDLDCLGIVIEKGDLPVVGVELLRNGADIFEQKETIQQAAAHATAKCILELKIDN